MSLLRCQVGRTERVFVLMCSIYVFAASQAFAQTINLGYLVTDATPEAHALEYPHSEAGKNEYNSTLIAVTGLVASDDKGLDRTIQGTSTPGIRSGAKLFNDVGNLAYVAPALGLVYLSGGHTNEDLAWKSGIAILKAGAIGLALKEVVGRERPNGPDNSADKFKPFSGSDTYSSFPSGHTLVAFSVATVWAGEKPHERVLAFGIASLVGLARVYSNAHWPSDVLVGAIIGISQGRQALRGDTNLFSLKF